MIVLLVLAAAVLGARAAGALGVRSLANWRAATRVGLAVMFAFTASAHFTSMRHDLVRMVPATVPHPEAVVAFTGLCELAGAVGLLIPRTRRWAGIALAVFLVAVFPANVKAAQEGLTIGGRPATALAMRAVMQILFIGLVLWSSRKDGTKADGVATPR